MPTYKVVYFNIRGRAELTRLCLAQAAQPYEDFRYAFGGSDGPQWSEGKAVAPFNQVPYLEIDGKIKIGQSLSMARYVARKHGLMGGGLEEEAQIDSFLMATSDAVEFIGKFFFSKSEEEKTPLREKMKTQVQKLEQYLQEHDVAGACIFGTKVTVADLFLFYLCDQMWLLEQAQGFPCPAAEFPRLKQHYDHIGAQPRIKAWLEQRPPSEL